jgi:hypothetical protein
MLPPVEANYDLVVQNSMTPTYNTTYNLEQKDLRFLNVWSDLVAISNIAFHSGSNFIGSFNRSYDWLRDKPEFSQPNYFETGLSFYPDQSLTLTAQSNNLISGLNLETTGTQLSWIRADRLICTKMSCLNGPISQVGLCELAHQAANTFYVDNRFLSYTSTEQMNLKFEALYI